MKNGAFFAVLFVILGIFTATAEATVYVNRVPHDPPDGGYDIVAKTYYSNTTLVNDTYVVEATVTVNPGVTLSIASGSSVQVADAVGIYVNGSLQANGVTFTHLGSDYWLGIYLSPTAGGSALTNCTISYAGYNHGGGLYDYHYAAVYAELSSPQITGCSIASSESNGIWLKSGHATVTGNNFANMGTDAYPIYLETTDTYPVMSGNSTSGTGQNGIRLAGGSIAVSGTWNRPGTSFPYLMDGHLTVDSGQTLTIDPGVTVKASGLGLYVNGTLNAPGTSSLPITFTSRNGTRAPGDWLGVYFSPTASISAFSYVTIEYAGNFHGGGLINYHYASLFLDGISPTLANITIQHSEAHGLELNAASPTISNAHFNDCGGSGVLGNNNSRPAITGSSFTGNGWSGYGPYFAVSLDASSVPNPTGVTFSGNTKQGIEVRGGSIVSSATWKNWSANAPYAVTTSVTVDAGLTLTIEPTTTVKLWGTGIYVNGTLTANSTTGRITFTSLADDAVGGDTNGDSAVSSPAPGNWFGIYIAPTASASVLTNCDIKYSGNNHGGGLLDYHYAAIYADSSSPHITGCAITSSESNGVWLKSSHATITGNTFQNMGTDLYPILFETTDTYPVMSGNTTSGTGQNGIRLAGGSIAVSGTWNRPGTSFPYLMDGHLTVNTGTTLTIDPGVTVKASGLGLYVNGTLSAPGTSALPITFTSRSATPAPGNWFGIYFSPTATITAFSYVTIEYAGNYHGGGLINYHYASLFVDGISPNLSHVTIQHSEGHGLELNAASPTISNALFNHNGGYGMVGNNGSRPAITNSSFTSNGWFVDSTSYFTVSLDATSVPNPSGVTFSGNIRQGIEIRGGNLTPSATWKNWSANAPYAVTGNVTVNAGQTLTINPTVTVKLWGTGIYVNGVLNANGAGGGITFTSLADDAIGGDTNGDGTASSPAPGNWLGIYLSPTSGASVLSYLNIAYSGNFHGGGLINYHYASLFLDSASPTLTNLRIRNSEGNGIDLYAASPAIRNCRFESCGQTQIAATGGSHPVVSGSRFIGGKTVSGFTTDTLTPAIDARYNYWGAASGPYDPSDSDGRSNPSGTGVYVSNGIDYSSYRTNDNVLFTITFAGSGKGSVTSTPADVSCTSTTTFSKADGSSYQLLATGDKDSDFSGWSGPCTGSGECDVTLNMDTELTTTFAIVKPVRIYGATPQSFDTIAAAYLVAGNSALLQLRDFTFTESAVVFNRNVNVTVIGGYDKTFTTDSGWAVIKGLTVGGQGSATVENVTIK